MSGRPLQRRWMRPAVPAGVLAGVAAAGTYVRNVDPNQPGHYPGCPFLLLTGYYCPGCGSLRMIHALASGHVAAGFHKNPLVFLLIPVLGYLWTRWMISTVRGEAMSSRLLRTGAVWTFTGVILLYWVVRNLPFGHALAP